MLYSREQIKSLAEKTNKYIISGDNKMVVEVLKPVLDAKCPFLKLDF